jgi:hypothetical protein
VSLEKRLKESSFVQVDILINRKIVGTPQREIIFTRELWCAAAENEAGHAGRKRSGY